jgi:hypothetical protein
VILGLTRRDKQRNVDIRNKLNQENIVDEIRNYQQNWLHHVNIMENNGVANLYYSINPMERGVHSVKKKKPGSSESE